ncbi:MAG TPA: alanine racemase [Acidimicrobiia bacterium]|nr:alanine racemase [Acidimicrobiia bacterium]
MTDAVPDVRPTWGEVDLGAVRSNTRRLAALADPAALLAVVKADGYGHGAVPVARAALDAGASWLGVALVEEGTALRAAGLDAPVLVLSEPPAAAAGHVVDARLTPVVYTEPGIEALAKAVADRAADDPLPVHLKVDTGMHRVGCATDDAANLVAAVQARPELRLEGICTHFAVADEPERPETRAQLDAFGRVIADLERAGSRPPIVHAANSAALLQFPDARFDLVRVGIALYGVAPGPATSVTLDPALSLRARVTYVKELPAGARLSYGLRYALERPGRVATVPVGYADGVPRNLGLRGGEVLLHGRRYPIAGAVTMDQLMVDVGEDDVEPGDEVVLLGAQDGDAITAEEWADRLGIIAYEVVTGIGPRVPRRYVG